MNRESVIKFILSFLFGAAGASVAAWQVDSYLFSLLAGWDLFGLAYIVFSIWIFVRVPQKQISQRSAQEDMRSWLLFSVVLVACATGLVTDISFLNEQHLLHTPHWLNAIVGISAIAFSWMMVHTSFSFRYAHMYYGDDSQFPQPARGITFPDDDAPDYFDFAYFSFVIGMTFQVSDVVIGAKSVRRLVLMHSVIAFVFNTVIIALTISELVNFK